MKHLKAISRVLDGIYDEIDSVEKSLQSEHVIRVGTTRVYVKPNGHAVFRFYKFEVDGRVVTNSTLSKSKAVDNFLDMPASYDRAHRTFYPLCAPSSPMFIAANAKLQVEALRIQSKDLDALHAYFDLPQHLKVLKELATVLETSFEIVEHHEQRS